MTLPQVIAVTGLQCGESKVLEQKAGTANRPQSDLKTETPGMEGGCCGPHDSIPWGRLGKDGLIGGQLSAFCLAGSQPFPPAPPLREGQEKPMTRVCIAFVLWNDRTGHCSASDLNVSPWDGSWPTLPRHTH